MKKIINFFLPLFTISSSAQDSLEVISEKKLTVSGYIDLYYQYDYNKPPDKLRPPFIYNFKKHNQADVNLALIKTTYTDKTIRATLGLMTGSYSTYNLAAEPQFFRYVYEANIGYRISGKISIDAGIFSSHIGNESAIAKDHYTLSRSLVAEGSPYYETGIRLNYNPTGKWLISILGLNGWQHIKDNNSSKGIGTQVQFKPNEKLLFNSSTFFGNERPDTAKQFRFFHNFYTTYQPSSRLNIAFAFDIGIERRPDKSGYDNWTGASFVTHYSLFRKISLAGRLEFYKDSKGIIVSNFFPAGFNTIGCSLNVDYHPLPNIVFRTEARSLRSRDNIYTRNGEPVKSNLSLLTALAFYF